MVGEGPKDDVRALCVGHYSRGQRREDLEREYLENYHSINERVPHFRQLPARHLVHVTDLYTAKELKMYFGVDSLSVSAVRHHRHRRIPAGA